MTDGPPREAWAGPASRFTRLLIVLAGIALGQFVLYGPSLTGRKILLPLDILAQPGMYLPRTPETERIEAQNPLLSDLLELMETARLFAHDEFHAGRIPRWAPYHFAGAPLARSNFSPFFILGSLVASPVALAWTQLLEAMVAGLGAYFFCRRALSVGFWPATIAAWCYPLTGFFVLWQGFPTSPPVVWLPWVLLAVDQTARGRGPWAPIGLSITTCLVLISGQLDVAAQVMLASGFFALWTLLEANSGQWFSRRMAWATTAVMVGWVLGFLLAAPYLLSVVDYAHNGARFARRGVGEEERPPVGWQALPQVVLPYMYGTRQAGSLRLVEGNELESSAATYAGLVATLLIAPLAWCSSRHRRINGFFILFSFISLSWCLNVPGCVELLRLPGLNMMSHNRFVFGASFAIVAMTAIGLDVLLKGPLAWRWWFWITGALLAGLFCWCLYRCVIPPEPVATQLQAAVPGGYQIKWIHTLDDVQRLKGWFARYYAVSALFCALGLLGLLLLRRPSSRYLFPALATVLIADLLWFGYGRYPQCDPALYFPPVPALDQIRAAAPGRIIADDCLPAPLAAMRGLWDIRGYDGVDPARLVELAPLYSAQGSKSYSYGLTRRLTPKFTIGMKGELQFPRILDMLNVRYLVGRGLPPTGSAVAFQSPDYWVLVNSNALPRAFVPERVETVADATQRLKKLGADDFDPQKVALVEQPIELPASCRGTAQIVGEIPTRVTLALQMETAGLVVLADLWDKGWRAYLNGNPTPILRANHAVRGVVVPAGNGTLEFRYEPDSFKHGFMLAGFAAVVLLAWAAFAWRRDGQRRIDSALKIAD